MSYVDGYIFPCYSCGNPAKQMQDTLNSLKSHGLKILGHNSDDKETLMKNNNGTLGSTVGMLWIDVEGTQYWSSSPSSNVNFIQGMVDEGLRQGVHLGKLFLPSLHFSPLKLTSCEILNRYLHFSKSMESNLWWFNTI